MPRILRITPEMAGVPAVAPMARQDPSASGWGTVAHAAGGLARTVASAGGELLRIQGALQAEDAKLDMQENFNRLKYDLAARDGQIRASVAMPEPGPVSASDTNGGVGEWRPAPPAMLGGEPEEMAPGAGVMLPAVMPAAAPPTARPPQPKDYYQTYNQELDRMVDESAKRLKYPGMERAYRAQIAPFVGAAKVEALNRGIKLQHEALLVQDHLAAREEAHTAVYGATPEIRAAAVNSRYARLERHLAGGLRGHESVIAEKTAFQSMVEDGRVERDWRYGDADTKNSLIANLRGGRMTHLDPGAQQRKADDLEHRDRMAQEALDKQTKVAREAAATEAEKILTDFTAAGNVQAARGALAAARSVLTGDQYRQWSERVEKGPVPVSDPETKRQLIPLVYNSSNNPREVDAVLRAAYAKGLVADDDMKSWGGHMESRLTRQATLAVAESARRTAEQAREDGRLDRERSHVETRVRELTRVQGPLAEVLNLGAQDTYNWAIEDLDRNSRGKQPERPMDWLKRRQPEIMARIGTVAQQRIMNIDREVGITDPTQSVSDSMRALDAKKTTMREDQYFDKVRMLREKLLIQKELPKWQGPPPTAAPAAAAPRNQSKEPALGAGPVKAGRQ